MTTGAPAPPMTSPPATGRVVAVDGLTKRFGRVTAVQDLTFSVSPGRITGFLGPNGAGKTTTLRMLLGLVRPDAGRATIGGRRYRDLPQPQLEVGAALEASDVHPGRSARDHLRVLASAVDLGDRRRDRVEELLSLVGLAPVARRRTGTYSLGMRQRLALASALIGDPGVLLLDEPANGLDPEGIVWLRGFLRHLADEGRTVLVSSHVLSEIQQTVDDVVIISRGRLVRSGPLDDLRTPHAVRVRSPHLHRLRRALEASGMRTTPAGQDTLDVDAATPARVGHVAFTMGVELHALESVGGDLETTFLQLVAGLDDAPRHPAPAEPEPPGEPAPPSSGGPDDGDQPFGEAPATEGDRR